MSLIPPVAKKVPTERTHHGHTFVDDYEWLRDKDNAEVVAYLEAENAYTDEQTAALEPLREKIFQEIKSRTQETDMSVPTRMGKWWYYSRSVEGKSYTYQCRCPIAGEDDWTPPDLTPGVELADEQILMDGNVEAEGHEFFSLGAFSISEDGTLLAYSVDIVGDERYTLRFKNLETGEMLADEIPDTAPGATWAIDHSHVFYMTVDDSWRPDTVWRHKLGTPQSKDVSVFHEPDERYWVSVGSTRSEKYLMIWVGSKVTSEGWMLESANPEGEFRVIIPRREGVEYGAEHAVIGGEDRFLILHNDVVDGIKAENFVLVEAPVSDPTNMTTLIEHSADVRLEEAEAFAGHLVLSYRREALTRVAVWPIGMGSNPEWAQPTIRLGFTSFITPGQVYDYYVASGELALRKSQPVLGDFDASNYEQRRDWAVADDGTRIPLSIVRRMGRHWYENGKTLTKKNTFTDFVSCAKHLIDTGVTSADRMVADGGSAGGLLMGAVANIAPELFAGILANWDEWGDPLHNKDVYDYMRSYSPYENVEAKDYPAILAITSINDTRVLYVEPAKWVAKLRATKTGDAPLLLKTEMSAGHGGVSGRYEKWKEVAFEFAWVLDTVG
eukprot:gene20339-24402_t